MKKINPFFLFFSLLLYAHSGNFCQAAEVTNPVTTSLLPMHCNTALEAISTLIGITTIPGPTTKYRIRATNGTEVQIIERTAPHFTMMHFPNYAYSTTYTLEIELQRNGIWVGQYGPACTVTTPAGASGATIEQCGLTLPKLNTIISTQSLPYVSGYRFRITNLTDPYNPEIVQILNRSLNWFNLTLLNHYNYGTTYRVEVALKTFGIYGDYGNPCEIYSPAPPTLVNCNAVIPMMNTPIVSNSLPSVTQYRYQVIRESDEASATIDRSVNYFTFSPVPVSAFTQGSLYSVRVSVMTTGTWSPYGDMCEVTSPGIAARIASDQKMKASQLSEIKVYPNPYTNDFTIGGLASDEDFVQLKIYDLFGREMESKEIKAAELQRLKLGGNFPDGIYNVIVSRGEMVKTIRIIKR